jgi:hypothetical protein
MYAVEVTISSGVSAETEELCDYVVRMFGREIGSAEKDRGNNISIRIGYPNLGSDSDVISPSCAPEDSDSLAKLKKCKTLLSNSEAISRIYSGIATENSELASNHSFRIIAFGDFVEISVRQHSCYYRLNRYINSEFKSSLANSEIGSDGTLRIEFPYPDPSIYDGCVKHSSRIFDSKAALTNRSVIDLIHSKIESNNKKLAEDHSFKIEAGEDSICILVRRRAVANSAVGASNPERPTHNIQTIDDNLRIGIARKLAEATLKLEKQKEKEKKKENPNLKLLSFVPSIILTFRRGSSAISKLSKELFGYKIMRLEKNPDGETDPNLVYVRLFSRDNEQKKNTISDSFQAYEEALIESHFTEDNHDSEDNRRSSTKIGGGNSNTKIGGGNSNTRRDGDNSKRGGGNSNTKRGGGLA